MIRSRSNGDSQEWRYREGLAQQTSHSEYGSSHHGGHKIRDWRKVLMSTVLWRSQTAQRNACGVMHDY
jgi:hypothetical protein